MSMMRSSQETVTTLPTVLVNETENGPVTEEIGDRSFSETALWVMQNGHVAGVQVGDDGHLLGITLSGAVPALGLQAGIDYYAHSITVDENGVLTEVIESNAEFMAGECEVTYRIVGDTIVVSCINRSCDGICHLSKVVFPNGVSYQCTCPVAP